MVYRHPGSADERFMSDYPRNTGARSRGLQAFKDSCRLRHTLNISPPEVISATNTRRFLLPVCELQANGAGYGLRAYAGDHQHP